MGASLHTGSRAGGGTNERDHQSAAVVQRQAGGGNHLHPLRAAAVECVSGTEGATMTQRHILWVLVGAQLVALVYALAPGWRAIRVAAAIVVGG